MRRRYPNPRMAKERRTYDVAEMAALYGCHRNTVRNWLKLGLAPIDDGRPALVRGDALNAFHAARRAAAKRPCGPGELYCVKCRASQQPAGGVADYRPLTAKTGIITGLCSGCERLLSQRVGVVRLAQFRVLVDLAERKPQARIGDTAAPSDNCDFEQKG